MADDEKDFEIYLQSIRLERLNLAESMAGRLSVGRIIDGTGLSREEAARQIFEISLGDSPSMGMDGLREATARIHPAATTDNVLLLTGVTEALLLLFQHLSPKRVAFAVPTFYSIRHLPVQAGATVVGLPVHWTADGAPYVDSDEWLAILEREKPDCLVINSPHNPSGLTLPKEVIDAVYDYAARTGAATIADEHYRLHSSDDELVGPTVYRPGPRAYCAGSFMKSVGCSGVRAAWIVGPADAMVAIRDLKYFTTQFVPPISEWIGYRIMNCLDSPLVRQLRSDWRENRRLLSQFLATSPMFYGQVQPAGLITCLGIRGATKIQHVRAVGSAMAAEGVHLLPLETMIEPARVAETAPPIERGLGMRIGMCVPPNDFADALGRMSNVAASPPVFA